MSYRLTTLGKKYPPFAWWEGAFTTEQLDHLQEKAASAIDPGLVGGRDSSGENNEQVRRSNVSWLTPSDETMWVYKQLEHVIQSLNEQFFQFDLTDIQDSIQLTNYSSANQGTYKWHQDFNANVSRKLSLVLQLSDPMEYEGGNLELLTNGTPTGVPRKRGYIAVFPSWTLHQVTPVTSGTRQSMVVWVGGPNFK